MLRLLGTRTLTANQPDHKNPKTHRDDPANAQHRWRNLQRLPHHILHAQGRYRV